MKYWTKFFTLSFVLIIIFSCSDKTKKEKQDFNDKSPESYQDLVDLYGEIEFQNCDEYFEAGHEIIDVYINVILKAYNGDVVARAELEKIEKFMESFDKQSEVLRDLCPEEFLDFDKSIDQKVLKHRDKLMEIYTVMEFDVEWDETLEQLEEQIRLNLEEVEAHIANIDDEDED